MSTNDSKQEQSDFQDEEETQVQSIPLFRHHSTPNDGYYYSTPVSELIEEKCEETQKQPTLRRGKSMGIFGRARGASKEILEHKDTNENDLESRRLSDWKQAFLGSPQRLASGIQSITMRAKEQYVFKSNHLYKVTNRVFLLSSSFFLLFLIVCTESTSHLFPKDNLYWV